VEGCHGDGRARRAAEVWWWENHGSRSAVIAIEEIESVAGLGNGPEIGDLKGRLRHQAVTDAARRCVVRRSVGRACHQGQADLKDVSEGFQKKGSGINY